MYNVTRKQITRKMEYVGSVARLRGHRAIVRESRLMPGLMVAQFDSHDLGAFAYGWHFFEPTEFKEIK